MDKQDLISKKISVLAHEGVKAPQRVAMAINMVKSGRVRPDGSYVHVKRSGSRTGSRSRGGR